jgi:hypothetical protein
LPDRLNQHIVGLFVRSPIPAYEKELIGLKSTNCEETSNTYEVCSNCWWQKIPVTNEVYHFENLQSTNWNSLRFKSPPSIDSDIGWRVEFRPMDIQLTDFENAALTVFTGLMVNVINEFALDFILPISKVDEGMLACHD